MTLDAVWPIPHDPLWETARPLVDLEPYAGHVVIFDLDTWTFSEWHGHKVEWRELVVFRNGIPSHVGPGWTAAQPIVTQLRAAMYQPVQLVWGRVERDYDAPQIGAPRYRLDPLPEGDELMVRDYLSIEN